MRLPRARSWTAACAGIAGTVLLALGFAMAVHGTAGAQSPSRQIDAERAAQIERRVEEMRARLDLTPEQAQQLEPILRRSFDKRMQVLSSYGLTGERYRRLTMREMRTLREEMDALRRDTERQVATVLDRRQMAEFKKIQDEARDQLRERLRSRQ